MHLQTTNHDHVNSHIMLFSQPLVTCGKWALCNDEIIQVNNNNKGMGGHKAWCCWPHGLVDFAYYLKVYCPLPHLTLAQPKSGSLKLSVHTIDII